MITLSVNLVLGQRIIERVKIRISYWEMCRPHSVDEDNLEGDVSAELVIRYLFFFLYFQFYIWAYWADC